jgi:multidrug efflux pump
MLGVTFFGILLTPVFFYLIDSVSESHFFSSPRVRRVASIVLGIITLSYLWRPSRWAEFSGASKPQPGPGSRPPKADPLPELPPEAESQSESFELVEQE